MKPDWTNARSAVGRDVAQWLYARINVGSASHDPFATTVGSWNTEGRLVGVDCLDRWLTPVSVHICELPEECWRWSRPGTSQTWVPVIEEAVGMWADGAGCSEIGRVLHIPRRRVREWVAEIPGGLDLAVAA